jgi:tRNA-dihydrouridine synthase
MADARRMVAETGCRSVMVGRGALGRPWVFDQAFETLSPGARRAYRARVVERHVALIESHCSPKYALVQLKKHLAWYTDGLGHARECRVALFQARSPDEARDIFQRYWARAEREAAPILEVAPA